MAHDALEKIGVAAMAVGLALACAAAGLVGYNVWDNARAADAAAAVLSELDAQTGATYDVRLAALSGARGASVDMATVTIDGYEYIGRLEIPALGLALPVMSEWSYEGLKVAPGRYSGTALGRDLVICAHNYAAHFGSLSALSAGDTVRFIDVGGDAFTYSVADITQLAPDQTADMTAACDAFDLTLFTCTQNGQARTTIRCISQN